jgi:hypothetical protein
LDIVSIRIETYFESDPSVILPSADRELGAGSRYPTMTAAKSVVEKYQAALGRDDWKGARALLEDDLEFIGPLDNFHDADSYIAALQKLYPMVESVDVKRAFVEGDDVAVLCDLHFRPPMPATMYVVEWYRVRGDKISRVQVVFDPRPMGGPPK